MHTKTKKHDFKSLLNKYLDIKGLDVIVFLQNGKKIEINNSRKLVKNEIIFIDKSNKELRIPLYMIDSIDFYTA